MFRTPTAATVDRFRDLADLLTRNATVLDGSGLPEEMVSLRTAVYRDVATQLRLLADVEVEQAAGNPLVVALPEDENAMVVARRFERLAGLLTANARTLTGFTTDTVMRDRAAVYRDVAVQIRMLAQHEVEQVQARKNHTTRPPLSTVMAGPNPIAAKAATRAPKVRPAFLDALVHEIAKRRRQGWSVARLTLWLRTSLRDPQTDHVHPCAQRSFVTYVTALLSGPTTQAA